METGTDEAIAYHEAGHAIVAWVLGLHMTRCQMNDGDRENHDHIRWLGIVEIDTTRCSNEAMFLVAVAGIVAERKQTGEVNSSRNVKKSFNPSGRSDYAVAIRQLKKSFGGKMAKHAQFIKLYAVPLVTFLVDHHWELISALAEHLMEVRHMDALEIDLFLRERQRRDLEQLDFSPYFYSGKS